MNPKIEGYKSLLTRIAIAQNVQFHKETAAGIAPFVNQISGIAPAFAAYQADAGTLDDEFNSQTKSIETGELTQLDSRRDGTTRQLINSIDYHSKFPASEAETEASRTLKFIADTYREAPHKSYQAETSYLRNLIEDLREQTDCLMLFGLVPAVDRLENENNAFEAIYLARTNELEARRERGTLKEQSTKTNQSFDVVCQIANGLSLMPLNEETRTALDSVIHFVNGQIHQYTVVYHRHAGIVASKKNSDTSSPDMPDENEITDK